MADDRLVREWLDKADEDLAFARANFEEGWNFHAQVCIEARCPVHWPTHYSFLCAETEKGLKAALRIQSLVKSLISPKSS